ncbi:MAG: cytochrome oxidase [Proteobacteria bacterium]|nr:cytochrome oxidase [Pseudomonadota bacterium]
MEVLILQIFVSLVLVGGALLLFSHSMRQREHEHADRLSLLALERDDATPRAKAPDAKEEVSDVQR